MKRGSLEKAYEITDARIQFVSLVDKAANKRKFLITKQEDGRAAFTTYGRIVKADSKNHYVTGIVFEPMTEDAQGNFMTEDEITKACYWFMKNGDQVDLQHSFEPLPDAKVVENWVAKADFEIDGQPIKKGTWLMTVEVADDNIWKGIQKGDITGFSMGGLGNYSEEDTDLSSVTKNSESSEKKSLLKQVARALGFDVVEKGTVTEYYEEKTLAVDFWTAFEALKQSLVQCDPVTGREVYEQDEDKVREALSEFNEIIEGLLSSEQPIGKALSSTQPVEKAGRELSSKNQETLQGIYESLGTFLKAFTPDDDEDDGKKKPAPVGGDGDDEDENPDSEEMKAKKVPEQTEARGTSGNEGTDTANRPKVNEEESETEEEDYEEKETKETTATEEESEDEEEDDLDDDKKAIKKEDTEMTRTECEDLVADTIRKAVAEITGQEIEKSDDDDEEVTAEDIQKMVDEAVMKAAGQPGGGYVTPDEVQDMVTKAVGESLEPLLKSRGLPTNLNDTVKKAAGQEEQHYLHGIL